MNVSPWLRYHTKVCQTLSLALEEVRRVTPPGETVYLCGGINGLSDSACRDWRETAKAALVAYQILDPMRRDYRGKEDDSVAEIVDGDKVDVAASNTLLVNASRPSWGTAMEIMHAFERGKRIVSFMEIA
jgi:hypothetical protein